MNVRIITLECLLRRLAELLGTDNLLYRRFEQGLLEEDERSLTDAMNSLRLYPDDTRRVVEDTVMSWLFGARSDLFGGQQQAATAGLRIVRHNSPVELGRRGPPFFFVDLAI